MRLANKLRQAFTKFWYKSHFARWILFPLSLVYCCIITIRRYFLQKFFQKRYAVPIIVVGNITVGGVGKTPFVIALAREMKEKGLSVGVVSRGYQAKPPHVPFEVTPNEDVKLVGDEPLLIAKKGIPVVIDPNRPRAVAYLIEHFHCDVIISDDGLQHYALGRDIEIAIIDGERLFGNKMCLPAGPLREPIGRLNGVDFVVVNNTSDLISKDLPNSYSMQLIPGRVTHFLSKKTIDKEDLSEPIAAVAGIGHPNRFFDTLHSLGIKFNPYPFADHHWYQENDFDFKEKMIVMTEKDAVKCDFFANDAMYYLPVEAEIAPSFWKAFWSHKQLKGYV